MHSARIPDFLMPLALSHLVSQVGQRNVGTKLRDYDFKATFVKVTLLLLHLLSRQQPVRPNNQEAEQVIKILSLIHSRLSGL